MDDLLYPKPKKEAKARSSIHRKKPKKRYKQTEKQKERAKLERERVALNGDSCFECGATEWLQKHEIFYGHGLRDLSLKYGMVIHLCGECHTKLHNHDIEPFHIKIYGQKNFERLHPDIDFMSVFGKSYL